MADVTEIAFGGRKFGIRPLTLRQLVDVEAIALHGQRMARPGEPAALPAGPDTWTEASVRENADRMVRTIAAALSRDFPDMTADAIWGMDISTGDLVEPYRTILRVSGLVASGEAAGNP